MVKVAVHLAVAANDPLTAAAALQARLPLALAAGTKFKTLADLLGGGLSGGEVTQLIRCLADGLGVKITGPIYDRVLDNLNTTLNGDLVAALVGTAAEERLQAIQPSVRNPCSGT